MRDKSKARFRGMFTNEIYGIANRECTYTVQAMSATVVWVKLYLFQVGKHAAVEVRIWKVINLNLRSASGA